MRGQILFLTELQIFLHTLRETNVVTFVNGVGVTRWWIGHTFVAEAEYTQRRIVSKRMHACTGGINHHGGGAVNHVTGSDLLVAWLHKVRFNNRRTRLADAAVDRENGADGNVNVDVRRTIQWIH